VPRGNASSSQTTKATLGLRQLIFDGELAPGERVAEIGLADRLRVSRTPLRIALATLAHEGLVEPLEGGGFVVRDFTRDEVVDAIEIRGVLEGTAARFAAERLESVAEVAELTQLGDELDAVVADALSDTMVVRYAPLNEAFHAALLELAKSSALKRELAHVFALPFGSPSALLDAHSRVPRVRSILVVAQHQHRALIEAIRAGHGTRAEEVAREHARLAQQSLDLALADHEALSELGAQPLLGRVV
jgi:GntR family transcriptional regulator of vanillate catabolism